MLALPKPLAKAAKDVLKQLGWMDRHRRGTVEVGGVDRVLLPISQAAAQQLLGSRGSNLPLELQRALEGGAEVRLEFTALSGGTLLTLTCSGMPGAWGPLPLLLCCTGPAHNATAPAPYPASVLRC